MAGGWRVPRYSYPWMFYGQELAMDVHPRADKLLADVDVLMLSKCSLARKNRRYLSRLYRLEIERDWQRTGQTRCWEVYQRQTAR